MHGKLLVAQTIAAAINFQILSLDETEQAKLVEKSYDLSGPSYQVN
jgi:hypothetical protein